MHLSILNERGTLSRRLIDFVQTIMPVGIMRVVRGKIKLRADKAIVVDQRGTGCSPARGEQPLYRSAYRHQVLDQQPVAWATW